jgi:hypothetical protein
VSHAGSFVRSATASILIRTSSSSTMSASISPVAATIEIPTKMLTLNGPRRKTH